MAASKSPVIFVPGIAGSTLRSGKRVVWGTRGTLFQDFKSLELPGTPLQPDKVWEEVVLLHPLAHSIYRPFIEYLCNDLGYTRGRDLFLFAYDWRQDCRDSARELQRFILEKAAQLKDPNVQFVIIAHSMGGLVARYCMLLHEMKIHNRIQMIVTAGTPHHGNPSAWYALMEGADILPGGFRQHDTIPAVRSFPSIYQLLPTRSGYVEDQHGMQLDMFDLANWGWLSRAQQELLTRAHEFHRELKAAPPSVPIYSIFGNGQPTLQKIVVDRHGNGYRWHRAKYRKQAHGDGTVPIVSAILDSGRECCAIYQSHVSLLDNDEARRFIKQLLVTGQVPSTSARLRTDTYRVFVDMIDMPYTPGARARVRYGLLDGQDKVVQGTKFRIELYRKNDRGEPVARLWYVERQTDRIDQIDQTHPADQMVGPNKLSDETFTVPSSTGAYSVVVTFIAPRNLRPASHRFEYNFSVAEQA